MFTGRLCAKHLHLNGLRRDSGHCVQCSREAMQRAYYKKVSTVIGLVEHRDACRIASAEWRARNPAQVVWNARARDSVIVQRTPSWANHKAINDIYLRAHANGLTVDHVIPLRGKNVSGLHVENNLQILPRKANSAKGNFFSLEH